jgi:hypothetical protein
MSLKYAKTGVSAKEGISFRPALFIEVTDENIGCPDTDDTGRDNGVGPSRRIECIKP